MEQGIKRPVMHIQTYGYRGLSFEDQDKYTEDVLYNPDEVDEEDWNMLVNSKRHAALRAGKKRLMDPDIVIDRLTVMGRAYRDAGQDGNPQYEWEFVQDDDYKTLEQAIADLANDTGGPGRIQLRKRCLP